MIPDYPGEPNVIIRVIGSGKREGQSPRNGSRRWRGATKERGRPPDAARGKEQSLEVLPLPGF